MADADSIFDYDLRMEFRMKLFQRVSAKFPGINNVPASIYDIKDEANELANLMRVDYGTTRLQREDWLREFLKSFTESVKHVNGTVTGNAADLDPLLDAVSDSDEDADLGPLNGSLCIAEGESRASLEVMTCCFFVFRCAVVSL